MNSEEEPTVNVKDPSFPDPKTKKLVEKKAISYVIDHYKKLGFTITDRQKYNCGYDLLVENGKKTLQIEVKGTASKEKRFFLTRNEKSMPASPLWRSAIVSNVLESPEMDVDSQVPVQHVSHV
ncbi:DUF3883 domain-containing protein [Desulfobulbus rhabdoformis]|uniref:DUF3883 domain-containing protein n=1 Tax=Desulfobulbus rhabdoformis TaxID=34032 RepID=UPI001963EDDA|nr:DUF3883 domain-containing protein [Desulfobulbus rhabdoformis]MBM9617006.1 DUF3883 domain-containing protein [Desulfobulbus rhabdoformis]